MRSTVDLHAHDPWQVIHWGWTALVTHPDGSFAGRGREGVWDHECRILSLWRMTLGGDAPLYDAGGAVESDHWITHLVVPRRGGDAAGPHLPEDATEIVLERRVGPGMSERILVTNHSMAALDAELVLELDADFADVQETAAVRWQEGTVTRSWQDAGRALRFDYHAEHDGTALHRASRVRIVHADSTPTGDAGCIAFRLSLAPRASWRAKLHYDSWVDGRWREAPGDTGARDRIRRRWREGGVHLEGAHPVVGPAFDQAADDLLSLRNPELERAPDAWVVSAGVPVYQALFGRDVLTASWQAAMVAPELARGALDVVARTQATEDSAWRDAEPGKMIHEMHHGPVAELGIRPLDAYYGTHTTPAMFALTLSEAWHWTGDESLLRRHRDAALRGLAWAERHGDLDGDGFLEYRKRSSAGLANQGWKDSDEAIRHADGSLARAPIATVEEQAYHYVALQRMAEVLVALREDERAAALLERAQRLRASFEKAFWMEDQGFYAMALDGDKRQVRSIGSNAGHALAAGMVEAEGARALADRLLAPDLFSGWGVRTLSTDHPSYNPFAYHLGCVWPVENATFALGMKRYGLDEHAERIITGQLAAAACFHAYRLPEALGGHARAETPFPTLYPKSNSPQAWSASATVQLVQIMLGLYPFAPARVLGVVRPRLPEGLSALTLRRLRVGGATVSIRFERGRDGSTAYEVIERDGLLLVTDVPPPQDVRPDAASLGERLEGWLLEHAPGRTARALRIALGLAA